MTRPAPAAPSPTDHGPPTEALAGLVERVTFHNAETGFLLPLGYLALPGVFPAWLWVGATALQLVAFVTAATVIVHLVARALRQRD